jgi:hypothetical protein
VLSVRCGSTGRAMTNSVYVGPKTGKSIRKRARQRLMTPERRKRHEAGLARLFKVWP